MKNVVSKIEQKAGELTLHLLGILRRLKLQRVVKNGEIYYKYEEKLYPEYLTQGNAKMFIEDVTKKYCTGKGIDIGASQWPLEGAISIENEKHQNAYKLDNFEDDTLDFVFSSHCLEHLERWQIALSLWIRKIRYGGILFLYLPHQSMELWHPGGPWVGGFHKWIPSYEIISQFLVKNGMDIIEYEPNKDKYWSFHIVARKI